LLWSCVVQFSKRTTKVRWFERWDGKLLETELMKFPELEDLLWKDLFFSAIYGVDLPASTNRSKIKLKLFEHQSLRRLIVQFPKYNCIFHRKVSVVEIKNAGQNKITIEVINISFSFHAKVICNWNLMKFIFNSYWTAKLILGKKIEKEFCKT